MTDEELAAIEAAYQQDAGWSLDAATDHIPALIAEVRRLRGLVLAVEWRGELSGLPACPWCGSAQRVAVRIDAPTQYEWRDGEHSSDCPAFPHRSDPRARVVS